MERRLLQEWRIGKSFQEQTHGSICRFRNLPTVLRCPPGWREPRHHAPGAVVVLQEIFGLNSHIRAVADRFAARGYLAVAPATSPPRQARCGAGLHRRRHAGWHGAESRGGGTARPRVMPDIQAAIDYAAQRSGRKVGIVGFCWGWAARHGALPARAPACLPAAPVLRRWHDNPEEAAASPGARAGPLW